MSTLDPFGRQRGGLSNPNRARRGLMIGAFLAFDLVVVLVVGVLFLAGAFGGDDDSETVIIPPSVEQTGSGTAVPADPDDDGVDINVEDAPDATPPGVVREGGTTTIVGSTDDGDDRIEDQGPVAPGGLNGPSMLREDNLRRALDESRQRAGKGTRLLSLRIEAARVDLQAGTPDGALLIIQVRAGEAPRLVTKVEGSGNGQKGVSWSSIDPAAPQRLVRKAGAEATTGPRSVNYVLVQPALDPWALHRRNGERVPADAKGNPIG